MAQDDRRNGWGSIPARGEEPRLVCGECGCSPEHPRARGGTPLGWEAEVLGGGASPRAGRNPHVVLPPRYPPRSIPARGEEPPSMVGMCELFPEHPRARGGTDWTAVNQAAAEGASPRAGRNPEALARWGTGERSIPARGEEP